ncbi:hypothetical protein HMSSN036_35050 [Paenibacillus macerans]|nr:hypothetical protein HMSSN036_35050 [Paenibacillus macerans]
MEKDILKQAYEQLGLPENAPREDVDKAFDILLRKSRSRQQDDRFEQEYEAKVKAYKMIIEAEERSKVEEMSRQRYAKWGKFAGTAEKIDDFSGFTKRTASSLWWP